MQTEFTTAFIKEHCGCYRQDDGDLSKLSSAYSNNGKDCFDSELECLVSIQEIFSSSIPTEDKYWFLANNCLDLEERKELFLLVMNAVSEATEDITIKEFIASLILYADKKITYSSLYESYKKTPRVLWVRYCYGCDSCVNLGFGLYQIYWLLHYLNRDSGTRELTWNVVNEYVNNK